jgi:hypothetical protein
MAKYLRGPSSISGRVNSNAVCFTLNTSLCHTSAEIEDTRKASETIHFYICPFEAHVPASGVWRAWCIQGAQINNLQHHEHTIRYCPWWGRVANTFVVPNACTDLQEVKDPPVAHAPLHYKVPARNPHSLHEMHALSHMRAFN